MADMRHLDESLDSVREALVRADSIMSLIVHRYPSALPADIVAELRASYAECRAFAERLPEVW